MRSAEAFEQEREARGGRGPGGRRGRSRGGRGPDRNVSSQGEGFDEPKPVVPQFGGHDDRMGEGTDRPEGARRGSGRRGSRGGRFPNRGGRNQHNSQQNGVSSWEYLDPSGNVRGPFASKAMLGWERAGYFNADLPVRHVGRGEDFRNLNFYRTLMQEESGERPGQGRPVEHFNGLHTAQPHPADALGPPVGGHLGPGRGGPGRDGQGRGPGPAQFTLPLDYGIGVARRLFTADAPMGAEEPVWRYIDLKGEVQGPFPASQMVGWFERGYLDTLDLPICGTERSVSPPDLPLPNVHYQKFGMLLRLVHSGRRFLPLTPENVESKSLPTYAVENQRGGRFEDGPGGRGRRARGGRGPRGGPPGRGGYEGPYDSPRGFQGNDQAFEGRTGLRERRGRGRDGRGGRGGPGPQDGVVLPTAPLAEVNSQEVGRGPREPRGERGRRGRGRGPRQPNPSGEEGDARQAGTPKESNQGATFRRPGKENRERGRGRARGRGREERRGRGRGRKEVDVALQAAEDGLIKLTISPAKRPERRGERRGEGTRRNDRKESKAPDAEAAAPETGVTPESTGLGSATPSFLIAEAGSSSRDTVSEVSAENVPTVEAAVKSLGVGDLLTEGTGSAKPAVNAEAETSLKDLPGKMTLEEDKSQVEDLPGKMTLEGDATQIKELPGKMTLEGDTSQVKTLPGKMTVEGQPEAEAELPTEVSYEAEEDSPAPQTHRDTGLTKEPENPLSDSTPGTLIDSKHEGVAGDTGEKEALDKSRAAEQADSLNELEPVKAADNGSSTAPATPAVVKAESAVQTTPGLLQTEKPAAGLASSQATGQEKESDRSLEQTDSQTKEGQDPGLLSSITESVSNLVEVAKEKTEELTSTDPQIEEKPVGNPTEHALKQVQESDNKSNVSSKNSDSGVSEGKPAKKGLFSSIFGKQ